MRLEKSKKRKVKNDGCCIYCDKPIHSHNLCRQHYDYWIRKTGFTNRKGLNEKWLEK